MIIILPSAREDLANGAEFYESQSNGLGTYFLETLFTEIEKLDQFVGIHPIVFGFHRLLSELFPYAIYYLTEVDSIVVKAILECRCNPKWIRERLRDE